MKQTHYLIVFLGTILMPVSSFSQAGRSTSKYVDATFGVAKYQGRREFRIKYILARAGLHCRMM